jgi:hypothetical protein
MAKKQVLQEREESLKNKLLQKEHDSHITVIKQTNQIAQDAILKEEELEELLEKEEKEREKRQEILIEQQIQQENKKNVCIQKY